jgi:hypothetical protein
MTRDLSTHTLHIHEQCPYCRALIHLDADASSRSVPCPTCTNPLMIVGAQITRFNVMLLLVMSGGAQLFLASLVLVVGAFAVLMASASPVSLVAAGVVYLAVVVFLLLWIVRSQGILLSVLRGRVLLPAERRGGRVAIDYFPMRHTFKRDVHADESLDGGVSMVDEQASQVRGALSVDDSQGDDTMT